jgi:RHS repeat-associated protein
VLTYTTRAGQTKTSVFDNRNREISYSWSDSTPGVARTYDATGKLLSSANGVSTSTYTYDSANQMLSENQANSAASSSWTLSYSYDADGNRSSLTYPSGAAVTYGYTNRNQLNSISLNGSALASYSYDANGNPLSKSLADNTQASYSYDTSNRLTTLNNTLSGTSFARFDYGYDSMNRRTYEERDSAAGDVYGYDAVDQVTSVAYDATTPSSGSTGADRTVGYSLDATGNRTAVTDTVNGNTSYAANNLNEYTSVGGSAFHYDGNGNLTSGNGTFVYDSQNRLTSATVAVTTETFGYDSKNRVVQRINNGTPLYLIYDGWDLIEERDGSGNVLASYVHGAKEDELLSKITPSGTVYYHHNALGSVTDLTNASGALVEKYKYDAYGTAAITDGSGNPLTGSAYGNRFMFTGREYLAKTGLYDYRKRVYSPSLGRFLQTDPLRFDAGDVNIYRYCGNNPMNGTDGTGLSVTLLSMPGAVPLGSFGDAGHIAETVGNDSSGYSVDSYGPDNGGEFNNGNVTGISSSDMEGAMEYAAAQDYTNYATFNTTPAQDAAASNAALQFDNSTYVAPGNDCENMVIDSMNAAGLNPNSSSFLPNSFFDQNSGNANSTGTLGPDTFDLTGNPFLYDNENEGCSNVA